MIVPRLLFILFISFSFLRAEAQVDDRNSIVSLIPQIGIPLGDIKKTNGISFGGHLQYEGRITDPSRFLIQFGGGMLTGKEYDLGSGYKDTYPSIPYMQLRGGAKFFPAGGFFVAALAGVAHSFYSGESSIGFTYAPVIGFEFGNVRYYNVSARYDASSFKNYNVTTASFSIGYHF